MDWIQDNAVVLQVGVGILTAVIWVAYLQLIVGSLRRERRSMILIGLGAGEWLTARCFVANMGAEPIYLHYILAQRDCTNADGDGDGDGDGETWITDREELSKSDMAKPAEATNQGPLGSGEFVDVGSFGDILWRIDRHLGPVPRREQPLTITLTVFAASGHSAQLASARRAFRIGPRNEQGEAAVVSVDMETRQIRSRWFRRRLTKRLKREMDTKLARLGAPPDQSGSSFEGITRKNAPPDHSPNQPS